MAAETRQQQKSSNMNKIVINTDTGEHKIDRHIYGHFSEHLEREVLGRRQ
jgi:alpha-L-arabinofuranosidase